MAGVTMKTLSCVLLLFTLLPYLQLLLCNVAFALVNKMRNYWNEKKVDLPMYVNYISKVFTFVNLMVQQLMAVTTWRFSYDSRFAWAEFAAAFFHLLGAGSAYIVNKEKLQMFSSFVALILVGLADGLTLPLSLVSTGDMRIKFIASEEDSHLLKLDPNSWLKAREDWADHVNFTPEVCHDAVLSVCRVEENIF